MRLYYRWFLALLFTIIVILLWRNISTEVSDSVELEEESPPTFKWTEFKGHKKCRNSVQGSKIIVDDRGYVCEWSDKLSSGCCFPKGTTARQFVCNSCQINQCCSIYEHCVSCCQHPDKETLLQAILANTSRRILKKAEDQFEFCLVKCRTSSESVIHENHYRNNKYKYCYGTNHPETEPS